jgi:hypothetical protein
LISRKFSDTHAADVTAKDLEHRVLEETEDEDSEILMLLRGGLS